MKQQNQSLNRPKILFVENDIELTQRFLQLAKTHHWTIITCPDSMAAIRYLKGNSEPDLLIIEKNAKPMNGFQTSNYLKSELNIQVPVLISHEPNDLDDNEVTTKTMFIETPFSTKSILVIKSTLKNHAQPKPSNDKHYCLNYLKQLSDHNEEFLHTSIQLFSDSISEKLIEIKTALSKKDYKTVREIGHNIKPSFEMLEITNGRDLCDKLVYTATEKEISIVVAQLSTLFYTVNLQLKNDLQKYATL
ncbi:hypothetical protein MWU59_07205 [Flavobacteriaceae bacterium F08102]|nr:hypothetical protein [Flavobacteriaceae bacterium F08102]